MYIGRDCRDMDLVGRGRVCGGIGGISVWVGGGMGIMGGVGRVGMVGGGGLGGG